MVFEAASFGLRWTNVLKSDVFPQNLSNEITSEKRVLECNT